MIKKVNLLFSLIILLISGSLSAQSNLVDGVIWVVGDEVIMKSDIEETRLMMLMGNQRIDGDPYCIIPEQLAVNKLFIDQARIDSIVVEQSNIIRAVAEHENNLIQNLGSLKKVEEYFGQPMSQMRELWRESFYENAMIERAKGSITASVGKLTPSEIRKYYAQLPKDSLPSVPETFEIQIITNEPWIPLEERDAVKNRLRGYTERVNSGESFATIAILESEDRGSAVKGGDLGFMGKAMFAPEFANVAFSLNDPKKVSNIVETEFGYHIIQLIERRGDMARVRHILQRPKVPKDEIEKSMKLMDTLAMRLRIDDYKYADAFKDYAGLERIVADAHESSQRNKPFTFEDAALRFSADKDSRNNGGLMTNVGQYSMQASQYANTARFTKEELPVEIAQVVDTLQVGSISAPFLMKLKNQKDVVAIVKLKKKTERHIANIQDDFEILRKIVLQKKQQDALNKWVRKKIKETYIRIDDDWKNCDFKYTEWLESTSVTKK